MVDEIVKVIRQGNLAIIPTDTVYGIIADATNEFAIKKVFEAKKRENKPLIIYVNNIKMLKKYVKNITKLHYKLIDKYWPGSLTILFEKNNLISDTITCNNKYIGIRIPDNKFILNILKMINRPLITTSANLSGERTINRVEDLNDTLKHKITYIFDAGFIDNLPSTVVLPVGNKIKILRSGELLDDLIANFDIER